MSYSEQVKKDAKAAADYIREHGWIQGSYYENRDGDIGACCALGAIRKVNPEYRDDCKLAEAVAIEAGVGRWDVHNWNDTPGRTKEEVLAVFDKIANS